MSLRIAIVVTHLLGIGHLSRAAALARALAARGHSVMLLTGGQPAPLLRAGGAEIVQLPSVHVTGTAFSDLREDGGGPLRPETARRRVEMAGAALQRLQPHVLVTELFPFGRRALGDEFRAILAAAKQLPEPPRVLASVRDILACPEKQTKIDAAHTMLRDHYDGVLVHSDPDLVPLEASWPLAADLAPLLHYTGYVDDAGVTGETGADCDRSAGEIVVSGGGSAAALPLLRAALGAAARDGAHTWRLLAGHKIPQEAMAELQANAPANAIVERARPDFRALLRQCAVSVSQFGYNTALDILATGAPAIVAPFAEGGETEQTQRAALFAAHGLVHVMAQDQLTPEILLQAVKTVREQGPSKRGAPTAAAPVPADTLLSNRQVPASAPGGPASIAVDGAERSALIIEHIAASHPARARQQDQAAALQPEAMQTAEQQRPQPLARDGNARAAVLADRRLAEELSVALRPVDEALRRAADLGRPVDFWWRDDDAIVPTPQLERLLALANAHGAPLAIAAIPAHATLELAQFLSGETGVSVLTHGLTHENLAPEGAKKGEFSHGAAPELAQRAAAGLARIAALFGARSHAVFTPPWNRIAPDLPPLLPAYGFAGVSTFRERPARLAAPGLVQVNAHIDPVAWRGDRSLVDPALLASELCVAIRLRLERPCPGGPDPIGLLTHHLVHDVRIDGFVSGLLALVDRHAGARFISIGEALESDRSG